MKEYNTISFKSQVIYVGIDVHKKSWYITERHCGKVLKSYHASPNPFILAKRLQTLYAGATYKSVYEAGFCGFWIHKVLVKLGIENIVINPADVPTTGREKSYKNDDLDSKKLARELENGTLEGIYVPCDENLELRNLVRSETKTIKDKTRTKNRIKTHFMQNNIEFLGWGSAHIRQMEERATKTEDLTALLLFSDLRYFREKRIRIINLEKKLLKKLNREKIQENLTSIPGIGFRTAIVLQSELWELERFKSKEKLYSYVGISPRLVGSGEHETVRTGGDRKKKVLHPVLIEAAWKSIQFDLEQRALYGKHVARKSSQKAISIVAKHLLSKIYAIWKQERKYIIATNKEETNEH